MHERFPQGSLSVEFDQIISQALRDGRDVRLDHGESGGFVVVIDGVVLPNEDRGFPRESFGFDLDDCPIAGEEATALVDELAGEIQSSRTKRRNRKVNTEAHVVAEGVDEIC